MNCPYIESRLSSYLDGELTGREMLLIREHLCSCAGCDHQVQQYSMMKQMLGSLEAPEVRPGFEDHLIDAVLGEEAAQPGFLERLRRMTRGNMLSWAIGTAGLFAAIAIYFIPEHQNLYVKGSAFGPQGTSIMAPDGKRPSVQPFDKDLQNYQYDHDNFRDSPLPVDLRSFDRGR